LRRERGRRYQRTPTLAANTTEAAALPPGTSRRAGRSQGSKSAPASVDGGRHRDAAHMHTCTEAAEQFAPRGSDASSRRGPPQLGDRRQMRVGTRGRLTPQRFSSLIQGGRGPAARTTTPTLTSFAAPKGELFAPWDGPAALTDVPRRMPAPTAARPAVPPDRCRRPAPCPVARRPCRRPAVPHG
jgi:hypothetical protein